jgi:FAD/FMN-containing dehydrogenase
MDADGDVRRFEGVIESALEEGLLVEAVLPKSEAERLHLWSIREDFELLRKRTPLFLYDISIPLREMLPYVEEVKSRLRLRWPRSELFALGHLGDGNLHFFIAPQADDANFSELHAQCDEEVYEPLKTRQGAISAEHGIGLEKKRWLRLSRSPPEIELMRVLKRAIDPANILNVGKVIDA